MNNHPLTVTTVSDARRRVLEWQAARETVALVPTMGNLHRGHISLVERVQTLADRVVCSIFVNPTQFGPTEDFEAYPRTLAEDERLLAEQGVDLVFAPTAEQIYPFGTELAVQVGVPKLADDLCGKLRPGHFSGVTTVVCRLLNIVGPDYAVFGEKDYQQLAVLTRMVEDLRMPVKVIRAPIVREDDGLALSSRNQYLTSDERAIAPKLNAILGDVRNALRSGNSDYKAVTVQAKDALLEAGFRPDYLEIRRADDLSVPDDGTDPEAMIVLVAAWLGQARLLDNLKIGED